MKIRFQADADLDMDIVIGVLRRIPEIDFQTATQAGLKSLPDTAVLVIAASEERVLVSHDWRTMPFHFAQFMESSGSPGVIIAPRRLGLRNTIGELVLIWSTSDAEEYVNSIRRLPL